MKRLVWLAFLLAFLFLALLLVILPAKAQVNVTLVPAPKVQWLDLNGDPLAAGHVHTYISGTTTNQATYTDSTGAVANANPVVLDSAGRAEIWLDDSLVYTLALHDSSEALVWSVDGVSAGDLETALVIGTTAVTFSSTPTFDSSTASYFSITLTGNVTSSTISNASDGRIIYFNICQDATGGRTFTWPASVLNAPTIGSGVSVCTSVSYIYDGTNWRELAPSSRGSAVFDTATIGVLDGAQLVDGIKYPQTAVGLQAALDAAPAGGLVVVPAVTIALGTTTITIPQGVTLFNAGNEQSFTGVPVRGTIYTYTGTTNAFQFAGPNSSGHAFIGGSIDLSGAGASAVGIHDNAAAFSLIERVAFNCANTTTQRSMFLGRVSGGGSGQHKRIQQIAGENCRLEVRGNGSNRVTTTVLETVSAHSYIFNITGSGVTCINCTSQVSDTPADQFDLDDVVSFTCLECDIEGDGVDAFDLNTVVSFNLIGGSVSGFTGTNVVNGTPTSGLAVMRGFQAMWGNSFSPFTPQFDGNIVFDEATNNRSVSPETRTGNNGGRGMTVSGGDAGAGATGKAGGPLTITGGDAAGSSGAAAGGSITIDGGALINGGADGGIILGGTRGNVLANPLEGQATNLPRWILKIVDHTDLVAAGTADDFVLWTLPANTMIHDVVGTVVSAWAGTGPVSAAVCSVGTAAGGATDLALDDNFFATGTRYELHDATASGGKGSLLFDSTDKFAPFMLVASGNIEIQCDLTGGNHDNTSAGQARIYILVSQPLGNTTTEAN